MPTLTRSSHLTQVLVIDADPDVRRLLQISFVFTHQSSVVTASSALIGRSMLDERAPKVIVCDAQLPRMGGVRLCASLADSPVHSSIPFVFLSTDHHFEMTPVGNLAGCLPKPFNPLTIGIQIQHLIDCWSPNRSHDCPPCEAGSRLR